MGLDGVELVMDIEDRFETIVPDIESEMLETVGALHDFLMRRIRQRESGHCITASMFYPLRQILVDSFGVPRNDVFPDAELNDLLAPIHRREFRTAIIERLRTNLPRLVRSKRFQLCGDQFPNQVKTVRQLSEACASNMTVTEEFGSEDESLVWDEVCKLVAGVAQVKAETLKRSTNFHRDLWF